MPRSRSERRQGTTTPTEAQRFSSRRRSGERARKLAARERTARSVLLRRVKAIYGSGIHWAVEKAYKRAGGSYTANQMLDWACRKAVMPAASLTSRWGNRALQVRRGLSYTINEGGSLLETAALIMAGGVTPTGLRLIPDMV